MQQVGFAEVLRRFSSEHGELQEEVACPLCGSKRSQRVLEAQDVLYAKPDTYPVVRCEDCSLAYVNPRPTFESIGAHYPDDYFCYRLPEEVPALFRGMARSGAREVATRRLRMLERSTGRLTPEQRLVDVGCGRNDLLALIAKERGAQGVGIDMKDSTVAYVRDKLQMPIIHGTFLDAKLEDASYDIVTMMEYLEHEAHPLSVLAEARRVLKPGGYVAIEIPDPSGWPARTFKNRWANLDVPRHLVFFDQGTLEQALKKQGFELLRYDTFTRPLYIGISVLFWLGHTNSIRNPISTPLLSMLLGAPFLPALPWLHEFAFAVARAV